ncbi:hypothetical protein TNCV_2453491 [Trichonephila clavipes]|nr:hypothetical protein TNCV_2453491 [Trichonephila clavipes]
MCGLLATEKDCNGSIREPSIDALRVGRAQKIVSNADASLHGQATFVDRYRTQVSMCPQTNLQAESVEMRVESAHTSGRVVSSVDRGAVGPGFGSRRGMDVCKCRVPLRHGGTLNSRRVASSLVRWEASDYCQGVRGLPQNRGGTEKFSLSQSLETLLPYLQERHNNE